jgi:hypothetical protein
MLAVETYNRPSASFRTYGYVVLMQIAWTSLLHAILKRKGVKPFQRRKDSNRYIKIDGEPKWWDLEECMNAYWQGKQTPVTSNLRFFMKLRNKIEHRDLPEIDPYVYGECQAMLFNFEELLQREFGDKWLICESLTIPLQFSRVRMCQADEALRYLLKPLPQDIDQFINGFRDALSDDLRDDLAYSYKIFLIPNVKNNYSKDALAVEFIPYDSENQGQYSRLVTMIRERQVSVSNLGKLKPGQVVTAVKARIQPSQRFNMNIHTFCWKYFDARPRNRSQHPEKCKQEFCIYDEVHRDYVYTPHWVDFLIEKLSDDETYRRILKQGSVEQPRE